MKKIIPFILIVSAAIGVTYKMNLDAQTLKIWNPSDINPALVDSSLHGVSRNHTVLPFRLYNQDGGITTEADFEGKIYIADFFFATCKTMCPKMSGSLQRLNKAYKNDADIKFISHTVYPENDSVPVLKAYAEQYGAKLDKWVLTTGDKKQIYDLARKSYFAVTNEGDGGKEDFIHTENFVLVDKKKHIRGFYDGTSKDEMYRLMEDIDILRREYED